MRAPVVMLFVVMLFAVPILPAQARMGELNSALELLDQHQQLLQRLSRQIEPGGHPAREAQRPPEAPAEAVPARDPFALTPAMLPHARQVTPANQHQDTLPQLRLRGLVQRAGQPGMALLETEDNATLMLYQGERASLRFGQQLLNLRLTHIHATGVTIEFGEGIMVDIQ